MAVSTRRQHARRRDDLTNGHFQHVHTAAQLNSELDKLLGKPKRTIRDLQRGQYIEGRLGVIGKDASQLKLRLKRGKSELLSAHA